MARRRKDKRKKRVEEPEPPIEKPPSPSNLLWSDKWNNGNARTISAGQTDPDDSKLKLLKVGDIAPSASIDGKGVCSVTGSSPRLYISAPNRDVKFSAEVRVDGSVKECYLVGRSDHENRPNGFGGYYYYLNFEENKAYFKKEQTHELGYSPRLNEKSIDFSSQTWHSAAICVVDAGTNKVRLEGYFDGAHVNDWTDDGTIKGPAYQQTAPHCFIRTNAPSDVKYRNAQITALSS